MLPRKHRLDTSSLGLLLKQGKKAYGQAYYVIYSHQGVDISRIAVVIPKKVAKSSVLRHRVKRQMMNTIQKIGLPENPVHLAIFIQKGALNMTISEFEQEYKKLLNMLQ